MASVRAEEVLVVWNDPATVDVCIELVVVFDPRKDRPMFWPFILGIAIDFDLRHGIFTKRERELL